MDYRILGPLEVVDGDELVDVGARRQRALLALLLLNANRVVSSDRILEEFWADDPQGKEKAMWVYISRLRNALEPGREARAKSSVLVTRDHGYVLQVEPHDIDAHRFEAAVERARQLVRDDPAAASLELTEAIGLWRGAALEDFAYDDFAQTEIARLTELKLTALEDRIDADLRAGRHREVVGELETLVAEHPLRERPVGLLMVALYRTGRQADALRGFERHRRRIGEDLGLEPSPELRRIEEQILLHDPRLSPRRAEPDVPAKAARNPFKGLQPFGEADAPAFFGRERLLSDLVRRLANDQRFLCLVGASGSGKSSVLRAGLIPAVRKSALGESTSWLVASMVPGARPFTELEAALLRSTLDAPESLAELLDDPENGLLRAALRLLPQPGHRLLLVIDQFEELFTLVESEDERRRFIRSLEVALDDPHGRIVVVLALRADFYSRPLEHGRFAERLGDAVMNMVPLNPDELELAAEEPAAQAGVQLEPTLMARLLSDVAGQSGGLPLFQYALTELFERRTSDVLRASAYEEMGGVRGALTGRAEEIYEALDDDERAATKQLLLRLVAIAPEGTWSRRRAAGSEIVAIAADITDLQTVVERFSAHRLLTFDRDHVSGSPTVEVAHEALLHEWPRLAGWIDEGREDVVRHSRFTAALSEWRAAGSKADYLLSGERLTDYEQWADVSTLRLSTEEQRFLDASLDHREKQRRVEAQRTARETQLGRQARRRLRGLAAAAAALVVVIAGILVVTLVGRQPSIAAVVGETGQGGINDLMVQGIGNAEREFDLVIDSVRPRVDAEDEIRHLAQTGTDLVIASSEYDFHIEAVAPDHPGTHFVAVDPFAIHIDRENITEMHFAVHESGFLAGIAAAMTTETKTVGFIGAKPIPTTEGARAGFEAGVELIDSDIVVLSRYVGPVERPLTADLRPDLTRDLGAALFAAGADIVFVVAGPSTSGVIDVAREASTAQRHLWVIGSDGDLYETEPALNKPHVLTSAVKRFNAAVRESVGLYLEGALLSGEVELGLRDDAVELSRSGEHLAAIDGQLKNWQGEVEIGHLDGVRYVTRGADWQLAPDVVVRLTMRPGACDAEVVSGGTPRGDTLEVAPGAIVVFEYTSELDESTGLTLRTIPAGVSLADLRQEAEAGIPVSYEAILGGSFVVERGGTRLGMVMTPDPAVPNCLITPGALTSNSDFPALILVPGGTKG